MYVLGISAYYHDSAAVLIKDGVVVCAIEEERFTRIKHDNAFPLQAAQWCLNYAGITMRDIQLVSYYEKPLLKFERVFDMFVQTWPHALTSFVRNIPELLGEKLNIENTIRKKLHFFGKIHYTPHHLSHAAAAYYSSPFKASAILTIDGVGEYQTTALWKASNGKFALLRELTFPHSLGLFYSTCAAYLGFKVNEDEYKLMGLAAYGKPSYLSQLEKIIDIQNDGSFRLNMRYFSFRESEQMWSNSFEKLFGKPRSPKDHIRKQHADFAKSVQTLTEIVYIRILNHLAEITEEKNVCISGGVALNALANGLIHVRTPFAHSHIFGPAGDSGAAVGSALYTYHNSAQGESVIPPPRRGPFGKGGIHSPISSLSLGSHYSDDKIEAVLKEYKLKCNKLTKKELISYAARSLADGKIIGWFQGRCELGPRALGNRSILCKPSPKTMKTRVNQVKIREQFRPFAGSILQNCVHDYFDTPQKNFYAPFMNYCFTVKKEKRTQLAAIVHADNTCRIQTVHTKNNNLYWQLISEFYRLTGIACVLNTSFNLKGEPIVESPKQAIDDFLKTKMDVLFIGNYMVTKNKKHR